MCRLPPLEVCQFQHDFSAALDRENRQLQMQKLSFLALEVIIFWVVK